jgi:hypothetical protein
MIIVMIEYIRPAKMIGLCRDLHRAKVAENDAVDITAHTPLSLFVWYGRAAGTLSLLRSALTRSDPHPKEHDTQGSFIT